ncbi:MAG: hypothetical protein AB8B51_22320 [Sedimentitalea sp.]
MLIFSAQSLAFIAVPKTGSTAIDMALKPRADILFTRQRKHMTARRFRTKMAPFLAREFNLNVELFAVMREPEEQIRSWYRYRARAARDGSDNSTHGISFDAFVRHVIEKKPPAFAAIGSQMGMLGSGKGALMVDHLFAHETPRHALSFLADRFGEPIKLSQKNVSPTVDAPLDPSTRALLRNARPHEFALYDRLMDAGGKLSA